MENKQNLIIGGMVVLGLWLAFLTYNMLSKGASLDTLGATQALSGTVIDPATGQNAMKPTNTNTQPAQPEPEVDPATAATMAFEENTFDFGLLNEGEAVEHVFKFKNTSTNPLTIMNAKGSCGCTVPEYPTEPINPGEEGKIKVKFDSKGKKGAQNTTVTLTANTIPANTILTVTSDVINPNN